MAVIQIIDDDIVLLNRLSSLLEQEGYEVIKTSTAKPAEVMNKDYQPDLVLLEVTTSRGAGWQLLHQLVQHAPVIILSSNSREEDIVKGLEAGAIDYVLKPYRLRELLTRIRLRIRTIHALHDEYQQTEAFRETLPAKSPSIHTPIGTKKSEPRFAPNISADVPPSEQGSLNLGVEQQAEHTGFVSQHAVFISEVDELALLRSSLDLPSEDAQDDLPLSDGSPGQRLLRARRRRRITLVQAENDLQIRMSYLQAMEEEKFSMLPRGHMGSQMIHSYASYLGLDGNAMVREYERMSVVHSDIHPETPVLIASSWKKTPPKWILWSAAVILALVVSCAGILWIDPVGVNAIGNDLRSFIVSSSPTPTLSSVHTPVRIIPLLKPSATIQMMPTLSPTRGTTTAPRTPLPLEVSPSISASQTTRTQEGTPPSDSNTPESRSTHSVPTAATDSTRNPLVITNIAQSPTRQVAPPQATEPPTQQVVPTAIPEPPTQQVMPTAIPEPPTQQVMPTAIPEPPTQQVVPTAIPEPPTQQVMPTAIPEPPTQQVVPIATPEQPPQVVSTDVPESPAPTISVPIPVSDQPTVSSGEGENSPPPDGPSIDTPLTLSTSVVEPIVPTFSSDPSNETKGWTN